MTPRSFSFFKGISQTWRMVIWHLLAIVLFFMLAAFALAAWQPDFLSAGAPAVFGCGLLAGTTHTWALFVKHGWTSRDRHLWETMSTLISALFAELCFLTGAVMSGLSTRYFDLLGPWLALAFMFPYLLLRVSDLLLSIPRAEYKVYYPGSEPPLVVFDESGSLGTVFRLNNATGQQISLPQELGQTIQRMPNAISIGGFFHASLIYHSRQQPDCLPLDILNPQGQKKRVGWVFYQSRWLVFRSFIDPDLLLREIRYKPRNVVRSNGEKARLSVAILYAQAVY